MFKERNDWYLQSNGFRHRDGYYFHLGRWIVVTEEVASDFAPDNVKKHVEGVNPNRISLIFSRYPDMDLAKEIIERHQWVGKWELISLLDDI